MPQEQSSNFNREIDKMLTESEERIKELRDLNRPLYPWEKERIKERLKRLENQENWDKRYLEKDIIRLKKEIRFLSFLSLLIILALLLLCIIFGYAIYLKL